MVLNPNDYGPAFFDDKEESNGIQTVYGYRDYKNLKIQKNRFDEGDEANPYNPQLKEFMDKLQSANLSNISVLDLGGAIGIFAEYGKKLGVQSWTVLDYDTDTWCSRHKLSSVDAFISGDAKTILPTMRRNEYDVIFSEQFLECIDDADLPALITEMNRVAKTKQIHIITEDVDPANRQYYNLKTLAEWAQLGFETGTILITYHTKEILVV